MGKESCTWRGELTYRAHLPCEFPLVLGQKFETPRIVHVDMFHPPAHGVFLIYCLSNEQKKVRYLFFYACRSQTLSKQ